MLFFLTSLCSLGLRNLFSQRDVAPYRSSFLFMLLFLYLFFSPLARFCFLMTLVNPALYVFSYSYLLSAGRHAHPVSYLPSVRSAPPPLLSRRISWLQLCCQVCKLKAVPSKSSNNLAQTRKNCPNYS